MVMMAVVPKMRQNFARSNNRMETVRLMGAIRKLIRSHTCDDLELPYNGREKPARKLSAGYVEEVTRHAVIINVQVFI